MKKIIFIVTLLCTVSIYSQKNIHYNFSLNFTLTSNPNFGSYDEFFGETDWSIVIPNAVLIRNGFDVELNKLVSVGINLGLDWQSELDVLALPYFVGAKLNLVKIDDDRFYLSGGVGKLLKINESFDRGNYYKFGLGYEVSSNDKFGFIINTDFHQKKIVDVENGRLNSFSFGLGMFFL